MLKVVAKVQIKEGKTEEFVAVAKALVEETRKEAGNHSYSINVSKADPRLFAFIEVWEDKAALGAHSKAEHFLAAMAKIQELAESEMQIELYQEV